MKESTARAVQVVAGVAAVVIITVVAIVTTPEPTTEVWAMIGSAFALIGGLLGVHYGVEVVRNGHRKK
jgi:Na+(H+)/acetate symporter ActP